MIGYVKKGTADERFYYVKDHLGSIRMTIDENSDVISARDYYAYGEELRGLASPDPDGNKYQFTEKERDSETELDYFGARYYDSEIGRWISVDPLADKYPGLSPYSYVANNPLINFDPDGRAIWRAGEGYISGYRAKELVMGQMLLALQGKSASIDFEQRTNYREDIKDYFRGHTYSNGDFANKKALHFGNTISYNTPLGKQSSFEFFADTHHMNKNMMFSDVDFSGLKSSEGIDVVTLSFITDDSKNNDVIRFKGNVKDMNEYLKSINKKLIKHENFETVKRGDEYIEKDKSYYTIEDYD